MVTVEEWFKSLPPITKCYFLILLIVSLGETVGLWNYEYFLYDFDLVFKRFQIFRLFTTFFYLGKLSMFSIVMTSFVVRHGGELETESFSGFIGFCNYLWFHLFSMFACLLIGGGFLGKPLLASSLIFSILYVFSRQDPHRPISFWGFTFQRWHLPFLYLLLSLLLGGDVMGEAIGIVVGHLWVYLTDTVPKVYGKNTITPTPLWISNCILNYAPKLAASVAKHYNVAGAAGPTGNINANRVVPPPNRGVPNWQRGPGHRLDD